MKTLFDKTTLNGMKMKNRFIRSGLYTGLAGENGRLTPEIYKIYEDLAKGGVGTIITGYCYIKEDDQANQNMVGIHDDSCIEDFKKFTDMIHSHDTNVIIQIACGGSLTYMPIEGRTILGPSAVANQTTKITPTPITKEQIKELAKTYGQAALRAKKAGFDGIEIHAAHGYFLSQFLCPYLNRRTDEYGGSIENRARILFDVYREVRMAVGDDYPIFFKINSADYMKNGLTITDSLYVAEHLAELGVDAIDVSGGNESITESIENNLTTARKGIASSIEKESYFKDYAIELSKRVSIPVILVGGNRHIDLMEEILSNSNVEYFALGRPLTCEPDLINRWASGDTKKPKCVSCNQCYYTPGKRCFLNLRKGRKHENTINRVPIECDNPSIVVDKSKCIQCGMCKKMCQNVITVGNMYDLNKTDDFAICMNCGQCANICPTGAITERYDYQNLKNEIKDSEKIVIFSTSPAVRVALGEEFGKLPGSNVEGKMVAALRALGGDYIFDATFAADLTICEEASELIKRITTKSNALPQFTSCCPSWVKYVETFYPEFIQNLSTTKSPISMQGAIIKTYFAKLKGIDPSKIVTVAVAPCTSKKYEIKRPELKDAGKYNNNSEIKDTDYAITTKELAKWIKDEKIDFNSLKDSEFDNILGKGTGAGIIFGNTGGVMESAVRTAYTYVTKTNPPKELFELKSVRGMDGIKDAELQIGDVTLRVAVAHGMRNAKKLLDALKEGSVSYDFVEVMNCLGGCIGGGGQPKTFPSKTKETKERRIRGLYKEDNEMKRRLSHENPDVIEVYNEFFKEPLSKLSEELLHTSYSDKSSILGK